MASYSDDFNRADGTLGGNWGGTEAALFDVNSNRMRMPGSNAAGLAVYQSALSSDDADVSLDFTCHGSGGAYTEICARVSSASDTQGGGTYYGFYVEHSGSGCGVEAIVAGSFTGVASGSLGVTTGNTYTLRLTAIGDEITAYLNGVAVFGPVTDTTIAAGKYGGVIHVTNSIDTFSDLFALSDVGGGSFDPPDLPRGYAMSPQARQILRR